MRFYLLAAIALTAQLARGQFPDIPQCSLNCFFDALSKDGCPSLTDFACHCQKPGLVDTVTPCVKKGCSIADQSSVSNVVVAQCSSVGHPIVVPPVGEPTQPAPTTTAPTAPSPTPTHPTIPEPTTPKVTGVVTLPTVSSSPSPSSPHPSSPSGSPSHSPSPTGGTTGAAGTGTKGTASASAPTYTGAACLPENNVVGAVVLAAAAVCML